MDSRKRIYDFVNLHPGTHLREIARSLELPLGTALYHLDFLTTREVLVARQDGRYKRFFLRNSMGRREKDYVTAFRHAVPRRIAAALLEMERATQRVLCAAVGVSRSTLSFHLGQMVQENLLTCEDRRPEKVYRLAEPDVAKQVLDTFAASFARPPTIVAAPAPAVAAALQATPGIAPALAGPGFVAPALAGGPRQDGASVA